MPGGPSSCPSAACGRPVPRLQVRAGPASSGEHQNVGGLPCAPLVVEECGGRGVTHRLSLGQRFSTLAARKSHQVPGHISDRLSMNFWRWHQGGGVGEAPGASHVPKVTAVVPASRLHPSTLGSPTCRLNQEGHLGRLGKTLTFVCFLADWDPSRRGGT